MMKTHQKIHGTIFLTNLMFLFLPTSLVITILLYDHYIIFSLLLNPYLYSFIPGWWLKTIILRDWWLCMTISIMFEILVFIFLQIVFDKVSDTILLMIFEISFRSTHWNISFQTFLNVSCADTKKIILAKSSSN